MRVAYLTSQYPAASHTFIRREVEALRQAGVDVLTYSVRMPSEAERSSPPEKAAYDSTYYLLPARLGAYFRAHIRAIGTRPLAYLRTLRQALRHRAPGVRNQIWAVFHFIEAITLAAQLRRDGVTRLHNHFANSAANVGFLASQYLGLPWSLTLHGISETDYPAGLLLAEKITAADFVACVSYFGRAQAMRITPPSQWNKMHIVRCGIDLTQMPASARDPDDPFTLICVGRLSPEKGQSGLLEAFASVADHLPNARLMLVGDGPERSGLENKVQQLGLPNVHFLGRLDEHSTLSAIADADLLVLPSFMEGLPVVLMEALALKVPVVASRVAGIPELVVDGETGRMFTPSDWEGLADAIVSQYRDVSNRETMAAAAYRRVAAQHDIHKAIAPLLTYFRAGQG